ncbi:hypothetical protein RJT34_26045 [Clitoria ternatea]|uniref:Uncharacterized protein n=1 Tax=Clitoria ternatea TaxID=43366 RepID=A0AAN9I8X2_CLITE
MLVYLFVAEDEPIASMDLKLKDQPKSKWDDEDVDDNDVKESWEDEDEPALENGIGRYKYDCYRLNKDVSLFWGQNMISLVTIGLARNGAS